MCIRRTITTIITGAAAAVQEHASKFFHVWPRLASVLRWLGVLVLLIIAGCYLIRDTYQSQKGRSLDWVDSWCVPSPLQTPESTLCHTSTYFLRLQSRLIHGRWVCATCGLRLD